MRTKALLGLAALAVGLSTSVAQNVYSLNVVGYVNVSLQSGKLHFLSLPLAPVDGNFNVNNTMTLDDTQDGATIYNWLGTQWNPDPPVWFAGQPAGNGWNTVANQPAIDVVSNGVAFFLVSKANSTLTFVGQVPQGVLPYNIPTGLSTLASKVPVSTNFPGSTIGNNGDVMYTWVQSGPGGQSWTSQPWNYYGGTGWDADGSGSQLEGPVLNPAEGVFYIMFPGGSAIPFTKTFTVQ